LSLLACWPAPGRDDGKQDGRVGSKRLTLHVNSEFCTGTYFACKDKVINPYKPKMINEVYPGTDAFNTMYAKLNANSAAASKVGLMNERNGPSALVAWLGFATMQDYEAAGFPSLQQMQQDTSFDHDRLYEMITLGAIFIVRVDRVVRLDTRKDDIVEMPGSGLPVKEVIYRIRRAQVRWCLDTKTQERVEKEAAASQKALAAQQKAAAQTIVRLGQLAPAAAPSAATGSRPRRESKRPVDSTGEDVPSSGGRGSSSASRGRGGGNGKRQKQSSKTALPTSVTDAMVALHAAVRDMIPLTAPQVVVTFDAMWREFQKHCQMPAISIAAGGAGPSNADEVEVEPEVQEVE